MKQKFYIQFIFLLAPIAIVTLTGQNHDYHYIQKHSGRPGALQLSYCENSSELCYNFRDIIPQRSILAGLTFSDKNGTLLGYFNGFDLFNSEDNLAINGSGFGLRSEFGRLLKQIDSLGGNPVIQMSTILPSMDDNIYYMFTMTYHAKFYSDFQLPELIENGFQLDDYASELLFTKIRINSQNQIEVLEEEKEVPILTGFLRSDLSACKHANGEDWWILTFNRFTDKMYSILVSRNDEISIDSSEYPGINATFSAGGGNGIFSPEGTKYAKLHYRYALDENNIQVMPTRIEVMDFNRCTGKLGGNYSTIEISKPVLYHFLGQIAFSSNARFIYFSNAENVLQFDLFEPNYLQSPDTVAVWDSLYFLDYPGLPNSMPLIWRLPNNTMAIPWFNTSNVHLIKYPDRKGSACDFITNYYEGPNNPFRPEFPFPMPIRSAPYWPEYRMPPLDYSCDDQQISDGLPECVKILPNPFDNELVIQCLAGSGLGSARKVEVYSLLGQLLYRDIMPEDAFGKRIDTQNWPSGSYLVVLRDNENSVLKSIKVVKQ